MYLIIDIGNTRTKIAVFANENIVFSEVYLDFNIDTCRFLLNKFDIKSAIICAVANYSAQLFEYLKSELDSLYVLDENTALPITNSYKSKKSLGKDRIAAAVGANFFKPNSNLLVVDAGTAITYDFVNNINEFCGGNIAPGLQMRLKALSEFTAKLPEVELVDIDYLYGYDTNSAMLAGVIQGVVFEIEGYVSEFDNKFGDLTLFLTGGDVKYLMNKYKKKVYIEPNLIFWGLYRILKYNECL